MEQRYTVTQTAEILGVRASVLRYWEEELELRICRNEQGHRYYTGNDITLLANIKELKKRGLALRAIKELVPRISRTAPGTTASKVKLLEDEQPEREKILEFQKIMERLIAQEIHMKKERSKGIAIDGLPIKNSNELMGISNIIFFSPEDLGIIKDGPEKRRRFMDMELCQLNKAYLFYLKQYKKVLKQRNAHLKQTKSRQHLREALDVWDIQLVDYGRKIIQIREEFINELQEIMSIQILGWLL